MAKTKHAAETSSTKGARAHRLKQLRALTMSSAHKQLSRAVIERRYGLSASTLRHWEEAYGVGLTEDGAKQVVAVYQQEGIHCSIGWLLNGVGNPPVRYEMNNEITESSQPQDTIIQEFNFFKSLHPEAIMLTLKDDAMMPFYHSGDSVAGVRHYRQSIPDLIGLDCIIETKDREPVLRRLQKSTILNRYNLYALNPNTKVERPHLYEIEIIACAPTV